MKTINLDEYDASKSLFAGAACHHHHPFQKQPLLQTSPMGLKMILERMTQGSSFLATLG
jgi:hypothetical protein